MKKDKKKKQLEKIRWKMARFDIRVRRNFRQDKRSIFGKKLTIQGY
jgi:hypothetical protein